MLPCLRRFMKKHFKKHRHAVSIRILRAAPTSPYMESDMSDLGKLKIGLIQAIVLAFYDADAQLATPPAGVAVSWSVTGPATITPSADGLSAVVTATADGTVAVAAVATAEGFSASDSATFEVTAGAAVTIKIQLAPAAAPAAPAATA